MRRDSLLSARNATAPRPPAEHQDLTTDPLLIAAVQRRWGVLHIDLAAKDGDEVVPNHITPEMDSLKVPWPTSLSDGRPIRCWLNPPFSPDIAPWAAKCAEWVFHATPGSLLFLLTPLSADAVWWNDSVRGIGRPLALKSRPKFGGAPHGYPKPVSITVYDANFPSQAPTVELWNWRDV